MEKKRRRIMTCSTCPTKPKEEQSRFKQLVAGICPAHIGYFIVLIMILIMQFTI